MSVSFIQMLKALMPVAVFATGCSFGIETFSTSTLVNMVCAPLLPLCCPQTVALYTTAGMQILCGSVSEWLDSYSRIFACTSNARRRLEPK